MSAERIDLDALASEHLDGQLTGSAWRQAQATHGAALDAALQAEQRRRAAVATLPTSTLPPALRGAIMDRVRATAVGATPAATDAGADAAPIAADVGATNDRDAGTTIRGPRWWWAAAPALLAALLLIAAWPLLRDEAPVGFEGEGEVDAVANGPQTAADADDHAAAGSVELAAAEEAPANEPQFLFDEARTDDVTPADRLEGESLATAEPPVQSQMAGRAPAPQATAPGAPMDAAAPAPTLAKADEESAAAAEAQAEISDEEFGTLLAEAKDFSQRERTARQLEDAPAPSADVTRDALAAEVDRRGAGDRGGAALAQADGLAMESSAEGGGAADGDRALASLALGITMGLIPADQTDGVPELDILLINQSTREVTGLDDLLHLQGLDAEGAVVWRTPAPAPSGAVIEPGGRLRWRLPLADERLPPAGVTALRLASGELVGEALPLTTPADKR